MHPAFGSLQVKRLPWHYIFYRVLQESIVALLSEASQCHAQNELSAEVMSTVCPLATWSRTWRCTQEAAPRSACAARSSKRLSFDPSVITGHAGHGGQDGQDKLRQPGDRYKVFHFVNWWRMTHCLCKARLQAHSTRTLAHSHKAGTASWVSFLH